MTGRATWLVWALLTSPAWAAAGASYELAVRPVDENFALAAPAAPAASPAGTPYFVQDGRVRVGAADAKTVYLFEDGVLYVIDNPSRSVHVLKHATLSQVAAHYADAVRRLKDAAAAAPPEERAQAEQKAADMQAASARLLASVPREFRLTVRFETVDGHPCRIWEERENNAKRLELCVAPAAALPAGAQIMDALKTLSQFRRGSQFALGVDFGLAQWWSDIADLGGVPLLIREFKYDSLISEVTLGAMREGVPSQSLFDVPDGYRLTDGPDYGEW